MKIVMICLLLTLVACSDCQHNGVVYVDDTSYGSLDSFDTSRQIRALAERDPIEDAHASYACGDYRMIGVYGIAIDVPGMLIDGRLRESMGMKIVAGTGDGPGGEEMMKINDLSRQYARAYNHKMLVLLTNGK